MADKNGNKTGGRQKGSHNKDKQELIDMIQEKFPNYHPLLALAELAQDKDKTIRLNASKEVCKYIVPQLKSVDHSFDTQTNISVTIGGDRL